MQERGREQGGKEEEIAEAGEIEGQWERRCNSERIRKRMEEAMNSPANAGPAPSWPGEVPPAKEQLAHGPCGRLCSRTQDLQLLNLL